jgi:hypothetical protein
MTTKSHKAIGKIATHAEIGKPFAEVKNGNEKTET